LRVFCPEVATQIDQDEIDWIEENQERTRKIAAAGVCSAWMLCAKLRRAMVDPEREPLSGVVEADETIIPFRTKNDPIVVPGGPPKILPIAPRDRGRGFQPDANIAALIDISAFGDNVPDDILESQYRCHPATTLRCRRSRS
jgi:hypothetical protein